MEAGFLFGGPSGRSSLADLEDDPPALDDDWRLCRDDDDDLGAILDDDDEEETDDRDGPASRRDRLSMALIASILDAFDRDMSDS